MRTAAVVAAGDGDVDMAVVVGDDNDDASTSTSTTNSSTSSESASGAAAAVTMPPSHILQDGTFAHLPPPSDHERMRFFERSIARHGLLQDDLKASTTKPSPSAEETKEEGEKDTVSAAPRIHPLALASARLQSNGINELNRAINLQTLVATGDYFGLSNIVDPSLERVSASDKPPASGEESSAAVSGVDGGSAAGTAAAAAAAAPQPVDDDEARVRASFLLHRKRAQFAHAAVTLKRHGHRVTAATVAQQQVDRRLRELRPVWRLVAPEHGTRSLPHAVKPTEIVCADVDVYYGNRVGRLASRVPRYATMELCDDYAVAQDLDVWRKQHFPDQSRSFNPSTADAMDVDLEEPLDGLGNEANQSTDTTKFPEGTETSVRTRAEPFAIADPALGKLDADFDPTKFAMLTLQFDIEKTSTGYCESACLEPISTRSTTENNSAGTREDEKLLVALQHSLFCAKLFESMRRELASDTESIGQVRTTAKAQSAVWLTGELEENFLPPPSMMIGPRNAGLSQMCVVHVHEGDVKVLLDCEYSLRVRLVEFIATDIVEEGGSIGNSTATGSESASGSQSPTQLRNLCQALLLHTQETHHRHSVQAETKLRKEQLVENKVVPLAGTKESVSSPCTLQSCVSLGTKMLFEQRIRKTLRTVKDWLVSEMPAPGVETLNVEWLALSVFDLSAQFTVSFKSWSIDANIVGDELTVTRFGEHGEYRKVKFHTDKEFELFLRIALQRVQRCAQV